MQDIKALFKIFNVIEDILGLSKAIRNLKFICCNRFSNKFVEKIMRKTHQCISQTIDCIMNKSSFPCFRKFFRKKIKEKIKDSPSKPERNGMCQNLAVTR